MRDLLRKGTASQILLPSMLIIALLPALWTYAQLVTHTYPQADDFRYCAVARKGFVHLLVAEYTEWSGRSACHAVLALMCMAGDLVTYYPLRIAGLHLFLLLSLYILFRTLLPRPNGAISCAAALAYYLCLLGLVPEPSSLLFWMSSSVNYLVPFCFILLQTACLLRLRKRPQSRFFLVAVLVCTWFACGATEMLIAADMLLLIVATGFAALKRHPILRPLLIVLSFGVICAAIVYVAPGNAIRGIFFPEARQPSALWRSLPYMWERMSELVANSYFWLALAISIVMAKEWLAQCAQSKLRVSPAVLLIPIVTLLTVYVMAVVIYYGLGHALFARANNIYLVVLMAGSVASIIMITGWMLYVASAQLPNWAFSIRLLGKAATVYAAVLVVVGIYSMPRYTQARTDVLIAPLARQAHVNRDKLLRAFVQHDGHQKALRVPSIIYRPSYLFFDDIGRDNHAFSNNAMRLYYRSPPIKAID